jgi:aerotaxis receptor
MKVNEPVTGKNVPIEEGMVLSSSTDTRGVITQANQPFINISGFSEDELLHKSHNVVRHPDMPAEAFADLWATIQSGQSWMGIVKNRCKNGDHYWVNAHVSPMRENGKIVGYESVRIKADDKARARAETIYQQLKEGKKAASLTRSGPGYAMKLFMGFLAVTVVNLGVPVAAGYLSPLVGLAIGLPASIVAFGLARYFATPLIKLAQDARVVVKNPLMQKIYTGRSDEVGQVQLAMKMVNARERTVHVRVRESAESIAAIAEETATDIEATVKGMSEQQHESDQVATAINEMLSTVQEVAGNAAQAASATQEANTEADHGRQVVTRAIDSINQLADEVQKAADVIERLETDSNNIGSVLDVIHDIAEQTNLLALNAAIEAARAGEQGRGFAVVADEVRTLASRTQESTEEIQAIIERLQNAAREAVAVMQGGSQQATSSVQEAAEAGASLDSIATAVATINDMNIQIASAAEEQSSVAEEINRNIVSITQYADTTTESAEKTAASIDKVVQSAKALRELISRFEGN